MSTFPTLVRNLLEFADENVELGGEEYAPETSSPFPKIVRIIEIRDTREYIEVDDRWVALSGTGNLASCARCGRGHEVHAKVELESGTVVTVGTGCAKKSDMDPGLRGQLGTLESAVKKLAALASERPKAVEALNYYRERFHYWYDEVAKSLRPEDVDATDNRYGKQEMKSVFLKSDPSVAVPVWHMDAEQDRTARFPSSDGRYFFTEKDIQEIGRALAASGLKADMDSYLTSVTSRSSSLGGWSPRLLDEYVDSIDKRIRKYREKIANLTAA